MTKANAVLDEVLVVDEVMRYRVMIARELVADIAALDAALKTSKKRVATVVAESGTRLTGIVGIVGIVGIRPITSAIIIGFTGDVTRFPTKGHFASYNARAPMDASPRAELSATVEPARQQETQQRDPHRCDLSASPRR